MRSQPFRGFNQLVPLRQGWETSAPPDVNGLHWPCQLQLMGVGNPNISERAQVSHPGLNAKRKLAFLKKRKILLSTHGTMK